MEQHLDTWLDLNLVTGSIHDRQEILLGAFGESMPQNTARRGSSVYFQDGTVDLTGLSHHIGLSPQMVLELLQVFVTESLDDLSHIEEAIVSGNLHQVEAAAHSLKGAALNLDFIEISAAARNLELAARNQALVGKKEAARIIRRRLKTIALSIEAVEKLPV